MRLGVRPHARKRKPAHVDVGIAGLGDMLKGLGDFIESVSEMEKKGEEKVERTGEIKLPGGRAMYGYSVKIGGIGPVEHFGNIVRETEKGAVVEEVREPFVDIFEEAKNIEVIAELPGVGEKDITYEMKGDILLLKAAGDGRKYSKEVLLPCKAVVLKTSYKNGVFKITLKKEKEK